MYKRLLKYFPTVNQLKKKKLFEISDDLTINEIREVVKAYKSEALKTLDNMDLFGDAGDADDVGNAGDAGEQPNASKIAAVAPFNAHDYYITKVRLRACLQTSLAKENCQTILKA